MNSIQLTPSEPGYTHFAAFTILRRNKFKFVLTVLLGLILTAAYFATAKRMYSSSAKLFIKNGRETVVLDPTARTNRVTSVNGPREPAVFAIAELLNTRQLAEEVVDHFGIEVMPKKEPGSQSLGQRLSFLNAFNLNPLRVYSERDKAIKSFQGNLGVLAGKQTNVVTLSYRADSPELARRVLEFLVGEALEEHIRIHRTHGSEEYFVGKVDSSGRKLESLETEMRNFKTEAGLASLAKQRDTLLELIAALRIDLIRAQFNEKGLLAGLDERQAKMKKIPDRVVISEETGQPQTVRTALREELFALEIQEKALAAKYPAENPLVKQIREQIAEVKSISEKETVTAAVTLGVNPNYSESELEMYRNEADLAEVQAKIKAISRDLESAEQKIAYFNDAELKLAKLEREIEMARQVVKTNMDMLEQARIDNELEQKRISSLNMMQRPTLVETPTSPKPKVTLGLGLVLSLIAGLGVVFLFDKRPVTPPVQPNTGSGRRESAPVSIADSRDTAESELAGHAIAAMDFSDAVENAEQASSVPVPR